MDAYIKIKNHYDFLPASDKKIAAYILEQPHDFIRESISELARNTGVSTASISRFVRKIGYQNLSTLKNEILTETTLKEMQDPGNVKDVLHWDMDLANILPLTISTILEICEDTLRINTIEKIRSFIHYIETADTIYLCGYGASATSVRDFQHKLLRLKKRCIYLEDSNHDQQNLNAARKEDSLVCISFSGKTKRILNAVKEAHSIGMKVVSITRFGNTPLSAASDETLYVSNIANAEADVSSIFRKYGQHLLVDILYIGLAKQISTDPEAQISDFVNQHYLNVKEK